MPCSTALISRAVNPTMSYFSLPDGLRIILLGSLTGKNRILPTSLTSASYHVEVLWPVSAHTNDVPLGGIVRSGVPMLRIQSRRSSVPELGQESPGATFHSPRLMNPQLLLSVKFVALLSYQ